MFQRLFKMSLQNLKSLKNTDLAINSPSSGQNVLLLPIVTAERFKRTVLFRSSLSLVIGYQCRYAHQWVQEAMQKGLNYKKINCTPIST